MECDAVSRPERADVVRRCGFRAVMVAMLAWAVALGGCLPVLAGASAAAGEGTAVGSLPAGSWLELGGVAQVGGLVPAAMVGNGVVAPPSGVPRDFWVARTHDVPQTMGSDPWPTLRLLRFDDQGRLVDDRFDRLLAESAGRPILVVVNGDLVAGDLAVSQGLWGRHWLLEHGALPPDVVVIVFDWPSGRVEHNPIRDINEKCRRAFIAGYHLAKVLQAFPSGSRICLLGQSYGGRVVPSALHLIGGGELNEDWFRPEVRLAGRRPKLHLRAVVIEAASDHVWLAPGGKLDRALPTTEGFLNLYNRRDAVLFFYPLLFTGNQHAALGRVGLLSRDRRRLGPLMARYAQHNLGPYVGHEHTMLAALAHPRVAALISPYVWGPTIVPASPPKAAPFVPRR